MPILASRSLHTEAIGVALDAATLAWVAAVVANGGTVSAGRKIIVNDLIVGLKADSIFSTKLDRLWLFAAENAGSALTDLVAGSLATNNSASFSADDGYTGNGSSAYIATNFDRTSGSPHFSQNSASYGAWIVTAGAASEAVISANQLNLVWFITNNGGTGLRVNLFSGNLDTTAAVNPTGLIAVSRIDSSTIQVDVNGSQVDSLSSASLDFGGSTFDIFKGAPANFSTAQSAGVFFGGALTSTERTNLYTRLRTYMTAVGVP